MSGSAADSSARLHTPLPLLSLSGGVERRLDPPARVGGVHRVGPVGVSADAPPRLAGGAHEPVSVRVESVTLKLGDNQHTAIAVPTGDLSARADLCL